jgi:3-hydroxybutyryl-CoA dehydrogenase
MSTDRLQDSARVVVVGAGTMGRGIAQLFAVAGFSVHLSDAAPGVGEAALATIRADLEEGVRRGKVSAASMQAALSRISVEGDFRGTLRRADLVLEAVPEVMELKADLFARLGEACAPSALLATNTSSLSVSRIAAGVPAPERVLGLHFFNPPQRMKLLEVIRGAKTSQEAVETAVELAGRLGKEAIVVKDSPGFATSRLGVALGLEAMRMVEESVASAADIDKAMELGYGHPMGPLRVSDLVGLDVRLSIAETLHRELAVDRFRPPEILKRLVREGKLGRKSGEGFYRWEK